jgi:hypothetical protein
VFEWWKLETVESAFLALAARDKERREWACTGKECDLRVKRRLLGMDFQGELVMDCRLEVSVERAVGDGETKEAL